MTLPINNAVADAYTLTPGATVVFGTSAPAGLFVDKITSNPPIGKGSARILSTSKSLLCTAFLADFSSNPPISMTYLTIVAKTKQKAAN